MLHIIHQTIFYTHISIGSIALLVFWLPLFAKKGSKNHVLYGKLFAYGMYAVAVSGLIMTTLVLIDPIGVRYPERNLTTEDAYQMAAQNRALAGFLLMLSVLVFSNVRQSIVVLKAKADRSLLKTKFHIAMLVALGLLGITMGSIGILLEILLFQIFAVLCILNSFGSLHYIYKATIKKREWIIVHLGNIIGAGIGAYTAFFAFGGSRIFAEILTGNLQVIPWILPAVIGVPVTQYFIKKYSVQYKVA